MLLKKFSPKEDHGIVNVSNVKIVIRPSIQSLHATVPIEMFIARPVTERNGDLMVMVLLAALDSSKLMGSRKFAIKNGYNQNE